MNTHNRFTAIILSGVATLGIMPAFAAQDIYDDIYGSSPKKETLKTQPVKAAPVVIDTPTSTTIYADEASNPVLIAPRDIDEYNRRGIFADEDPAVGADSLVTADFDYTRRIERFYNPDVVIASNDPTLTDLYYVEQPASVNVYVNAGGYWGYPYYSYSPWYFGPTWSWQAGWGPISWGWTWGWGYDPWYWNWGWGPSYAWGWGPGWGPGYGPGYAPGPQRPTYNPRHPGATAAAMRNQFGTGHNRNDGSNVSNRVHPGARPGAVSTSNAANRQPSTTQSSQTLRPSGSSATHSGSRPAATQSRPSSSSSSSSYKPSNSSQSRPTYNSGGSRSSGSRSSGGSRGGGGGGRGRH